MAARGLFFLCANAIKSDRHCFFLEKSIKHHPESVPERPQRQNICKYVRFGLPKRSQIIPERPRAFPDHPQTAPRASQSVPRACPDEPKTMRKLCFRKSAIFGSTCWGFVASFGQFPIQIMSKFWFLFLKKHGPVDKFDSTPPKLQVGSVHYLQHLRGVGHDPYTIYVTFANRSNIAYIVYGSRFSAHKYRV